MTRRSFLGGAAGGLGPALLPGAAHANLPDGARVLPLRDEMRTDRQWEAFLAEQDPVWGRVPSAWYEAPFLGNGRQATMAYQPPGRNAAPRRPALGRAGSPAVPEQGHDRQGRLPIGAFFPEPAGSRSCSTARPRARSSSGGSARLTRSSPDATVKTVPGTPDMIRRVLRAVLAARGPPSRGCRELRRRAQSGPGLFVAVPAAHPGRRRDRAQGARAWPATARVCCHPLDEGWPRDAAVLETVPVRSRSRRGRAVDSVLDRGQRNRSGSFTAPQAGRRGGRPMIFWQTARTGPAPASASRAPVWPAPS